MYPKRQPASTIADGCNCRRLAQNVPAVDLTAWLEQVEAARLELGWSQRRLAREAGLKNDGNYNVIVQRIRDKGQEAAPSAQTIEAITSALQRAGALRPSSERPPSRTVEVEDRYADAREVVTALVDDGYAFEAAKRAVGSVVFDEGPEGSSALHLFRAAKRLLDSERGRPELGVRRR